MQNLGHESDLGGSSELQVAGLPHRNPPLSDWVKYPFPSTGILMYPKVDYSSLYRPGATEIVVQPDYSASTGQRNYVRAFDTAFSRSTAGVIPPYPVNTMGSTDVVLRIDGITLRDFGYSPPGPGNPLISGLSIQLKVPGLTTWMDLGRLDGSGPSKQDPALDGAGCQVAGEYTYDSVDGETGVVYCQVKANVGPEATLALGVGGEVPVLVKVTMQDPAGGSSSASYDFTFEAKLPTDVYGWTGDSGCAIETSRVRGVVGIQVVHPDLVLSNPNIPPVSPYNPPV